MQSNFDEQMKWLANTSTGTHNNTHMPVTQAVTKTEVKAPASVDEDAHLWPASDGMGDDFYLAIKTPTAYKSSARSSSISVIEAPMAAIDNHHEVLDLTMSQERVPSSSSSSLPDANVVVQLELKKELKRSNADALLDLMDHGGAEHDIKRLRAERSSLIADIHRLENNTLSIIRQDEPLQIVELLTDSGEKSPGLEQSNDVEDEIIAWPAQEVTTLSDDPMAKWRRMDFPWSDDIKKAMRYIFGLKAFRQNQLEAVNAVLAGNDCFVLMPTGGGKSLCYQLPAIVSTGATAGISVVISPLLSLIQDQIQSLTKKGIAASWLSGSMDPAQRNWLFAEMRKAEPVLKMLYMTPEMIGKSGQAKDAIRSLYQRKVLARFIIDEAHCLSQWGHDV